MTQGFTFRSMKPALGEGEHLDRKHVFVRIFFNLFPLYLPINCIPINYTTILNLTNVCCLNTRVVRSVDEVTISQTYPDMI